MEVSQVLGRNICNICEVLALLYKLFQVSLMHYLWSSSVDKHRVLWHLTQQSIVDRILCLICGWAVQGHKLGIEQLLNLCAISRPGSLDLFLRQVWIISRKCHVEGLCNAVQVARNSAKAIDCYGLAHELVTTGSIPMVSCIRNHHAKGKLGNSIGISTRSVHGDDVSLSSSWQINVVITSTSTDNQLELLAGIHDLCRCNVAANDDCVNIRNCIQKLLLFLVILELLQCVPCSSKGVLDVFDSRSSEGLLSSEEYCF